MTSCAQVIENNADEIRLNKWNEKLKNDGEAVLCFDEDNAVFNILYKNKKFNVKVSGKAFFDKNKLIIFDKSDYHNYIFNYKLKDNHLFLKYDGGTLKLKKQKSKK